MRKRKFTKRDVMKMRLASEEVRRAADEIEFIRPGLAVMFRKWADEIEQEAATAEKEVS
jgi:hypothetical protein